jgi:hypothetical protein
MTLKEKLKYRLAAFRGKSWFVFSIYPGMQYWHLTILIGPPGWGKQRWISYHKEWAK